MEVATTHRRREQYNPCVVFFNDLVPPIRSRIESREFYRQTRGEELSGITAPRGMHDALRCCNLFHETASDVIVSSLSSCDHEPRLTLGLTYALCMATSKCVHDLGRWKHTKLHKLIIFAVPLVPFIGAAYPVHQKSNFTNVCHTISIPHTEVSF
ncbi:hypothetical protein IW261DRAFT_1490166 [Armillaria novae-zelandiae]|uniref:Uncharacterized protein n=1 Tax=Armillaria novae-zelandiae TaxID=153914 RepID=A0AA39P3V6_9AGAR|nr:hypothetical protein IW261DRAFT_1490166 [Armillaria novae-zelandiae]